MTYPILNYDVIRVIVSFLDTSSLLKFRLTCKEFNNLIFDVCEVSPIVGVERNISYMMGRHGTLTCANLENIGRLCNLSKTRMWFFRWGCSILSPKELKWFVNGKHSPLITREDVISNNNVVFRFACEYSFLDTVKWLYTTFSLTEEAAHAKDNYCFRLACVKGKLNIAKWLYTTFTFSTEEVCCLDNFAFQYACTSGKLPVCKWLVEDSRGPLIQRENVDIIMEEMLQCLCEFGDVRMVRWLIKTYSLTKHDFTTHNKWAFRFACGNANILLCKWLVNTLINPPFNKRDICLDENYIFRLVCGNGELGMMKWLVNTFSITKLDTWLDNASIFHSACRCGELELVKWLMDPGGFSLTKEDVYSKDSHSMWLACENGDLELCKYLTTCVDKKEPIVPLEDVIKNSINLLLCACECNQLDIIKWFVTDSNGPLIPKEQFVWISNNILETLCSFGSLKIIQWLDTYFSLMKTEVLFGRIVLRFACKNENTRVIEWLFTSYFFNEEMVNFGGEGTIQFVLENGSTNVLEWVLNFLSSHRSMLEK